MNLIRLVFATFLLIGSLGQAAESSGGGGGGGIGLNVGVGLPFVSQAGVNFRLSNQIGFSLGYNLLSLTSGEASLKLSMPEALVYFHPFSGAFFLGGGVGKETLNAKATDSGTNNEVTIDVTANTMIGKLGWMWGAANGGFWFGIDFSYIKPSNGKTTIVAPGVPTTDQTYIDAVDAADKFGNTAYVNVTFARFGWLF